MDYLAQIEKLEQQMSPEEMALFNAANEYVRQHMLSILGEEYNGLMSLLSLPEDCTDVEYDEIIQKFGITNVQISSGIKLLIEARMKYMESKQVRKEALH